MAAIFDAPVICLQNLLQLRTQFQNLTISAHQCPVWLIESRNDMKEELLWWDEHLTFSCHPFSKCANLSTWSWCFHDYLQRLWLIIFFKSYHSVNLVAREWQSLWTNYHLETVWWVFGHRVIGVVCLKVIWVACNRNASLTNASPTIAHHSRQCCLHLIIWLFNLPLVQLCVRRLFLPLAYTLQMCDCMLLVDEEESVDQWLLMVMVEFQTNDFITLAREAVTLLHLPSLTRHTFY